jgi:response regulator NasT
MTNEDVSKGARLLVADDDSLVLATLTSGLRNLGYDVTGVESGEEVVQLCEHEKYDLALLDMRMHGLSGIEAAQTMNESCRTPVVFLSAFDDDEYVQKAIEAGALGYLVKPVDVKQIVPTIEAALIRARDFHELREREENLTYALNAGRETNVAIGILMSSTGMNYEMAEKALRNYARANRERMQVISAKLVAASNSMNKLVEAIYSQVDKNE